MGFFLHGFFLKEMNTKCEQLNIEGKLKKKPKKQMLVDGF